MARKHSSSPPSSLGIIPPRSRMKNVLSPYIWLEERQDNDGAEGLWRIHDGLYDFSEFLKKHPGGSQWLIMTKGTDITEAFESHHISELPEQILSKYYIKKTSTKRNSPFTFGKNGFYRTLKREVNQTIKNLPKVSYTNSDFYSDALFAGLISLSILSVRIQSYVIGIIAGIILGLLTTAAHNYIHRKNNFRMFYFQFSLFLIRDWRISHVLSHHLYTNTIIDLEISMPEPFLEYRPIKKLFGGYLSVIIAPGLWLFGFHGSFIKRLAIGNIKVQDLTGFFLPIIMYIYGTNTLLNTFVMWNVILLVGSFEFALMGLHATHHHPDIFHDGDTPRSVTSYDWGLSQLDAVIDRKEITGSDFLVLTTFGDHCLHHLFPTVDHSLLKHLYPVLVKVMRQFDVNMRMTSQWEAFVGGFQQLVKVTPNPFPPDLKNKKYILI